ncbi:MAG: peptidoglycan bridge formation glycyltransferase FemA/FemB family protein [Actinobacteria bacterium]|nr:peptidoglycan bridge formation glycyltransferase FemA/FemB family protein [Actinomycetota bacterium]
MSLTLRAITANQHADWVAGRSSVSFLQLPEWGEVKKGWRAESVGWFDASRLVGAALVLYRPVPRLPQRSLAYLPEGPDIDWLRKDHPHLRLDDWLRPLLAHCKANGAFQVKMGPPVALRRWNADTVKAAMSEWQGGAVNPTARISEVLADWHSGSGAKVVDQLKASGWTQEQAAGAGFGDVQPRYVFQVPLAGRTLGDVFAGFNQLWRRNIRKAEKAGVVVSRGDRSDLAAFHHVYVETAARDHFTPRALSYFEHMWDCLNSREERLRLYCAHHDGHLAAATLMVTVGTHAWYSYGASTTADRDVRPSNALQWRMISEAHELGCTIYDLRGIADTLDPSNHLFGLVQFKLGTGGFVQEYAGEWDVVLRPLWARAFSAYQARQG